MGVRLVAQSCWTTESTKEPELVFEFDQDRILIGRGRGADVRLPHRAVSVRHATIELSGAHYTIVDHSTTNGTLVEGHPIVAGRPKKLRPGDLIEVGGFALRFQAGVPVTRPTSAERTASLARRLVRDSVGAAERRPSPYFEVLAPRAAPSITLPPAPARWVAGRAENADLPLADEDASREHAEIEVGLDGVWVRDLRSKNGTFVGGRRVQERLLADEDEVRIGNTILRFCDPAAADVAALEEGDDVAVEPPRYVPPAPEPAPSEEGEDDIEAPDPGELAPPRDVPAPDRRVPRTVSAADMVIYVLAALVFGLSLVGLLWLLRGS